MRETLRDKLTRNWLWWSGVALCALLVLLAFLQYRWIDRLSAIEYRQRTALLDNVLRAVRAEAERPMRDLSFFFRRAVGVEPGTLWETKLAETTTRWASEGERPALLGAVSYLLRQPDGTVLYRRRVLPNGTFANAALPHVWEFYQMVLTQRWQRPNGRPPLLARELIYEQADGQPAVAFPLLEDARRVAQSQPDQEPPPRPGIQVESRPLKEWQNEFAATETGTAPAALQLRGWCFLELNATYLQKQFYPELAEHYFRLPGMEGFSYALLTDTPPRILFRSENVPAEWLAPNHPSNLGSKASSSTALESGADAVIPLFARHIVNLQIVPRPPRGAPPLLEARRDPPAAGRNNNATLDPLAWRFVIKANAGSLERAVAQMRRRNLVLSFGVLAVLGSSFALLLLALRRVQRLAAQQLEFVAGVSHELRTPLTVIQSTSHNLAQGLVKDPQRVQQYGVAIQAETRRLAHQLEQVLAFAGIQSGRKLYDLQPVNIKALCERAVAAQPFVAEGWQVELNLPDDLPPALADENALEAILNNLLHNAYKYATAGHWLRLSAQQVRAEIQVTIADHGPGIATEDRPHLFKPFYRGQRVLASSVAGAGLGLSLVQRHLQAMGGSIRVQNDGGAAFIVRLRIASITEMKHTTA